MIANPVTSKQPHRECPVTAAQDRLYRHQSTTRTGLLERIDNKGTGGRNGYGCSIYIVPTTLRILL